MAGERCKAPPTPFGTAQPCGRLGDSRPTVIVSRRFASLRSIGGQERSGTQQDSNSPSSNPNAIKIDFPTLNLTADHPKSKMAFESVFLFDFSFRFDSFLRLCDTHKNNTRRSNVFREIAWRETPSTGTGVDLIDLKLLFDLQSHAPGSVLAKTRQASLPLRWPPSLFCGFRAPCVSVQLDAFGRALLQVCASKISGFYTPIRTESGNVWKNCQNISCLRCWEQGNIVM